MDRKVLVISYLFPPMGGAGIQRISKFVKYLGQYGWIVSVLTVSNPSVPLLDKSLSADIPKNIKVYTAKTLEPSYKYKQYATKNTNRTDIISRIKKSLKLVIQSILLPDLQVLWFPFASFFLLRYLKKNKVDVILATAPPFSSLVLAVFWGRIFNIPVVSDFRDEWSFSRNNWENLPKFRLIKWLDRRLEKYVIQKSAYITVASPAYEHTIKSNYLVDNCSTITNGYDNDDFILVKGAKLDLEKGKINIIYSGTVWSATTLRPFIRALENVLVSKPSLQNIIRFTLIGRVVPEEVSYFEPLETAGVVRLLGYIDHEQLVQYILAADILVLSLAEMKGSEKIIPGKVFEYMKCSAPVISMIPVGACSEIISKITGFYIVSPSDDKQIEACIHKIIMDVQSQTLCDKKMIAPYCRKYLTEKLAVIMNSVMSQN